jgi:hypothetical protein
MKRFTIFLASLLMLVSLKTNAQNERMLLLESFTNTGCGPCAMYNPGMDAIIANNPDKVVAIKYHVSWPSGADPMYLHNTSDNGSRVSYYSINSVPHVVVDGNRFSGNSGNITQSIIDQLSVIESPMQLRLSWELNDAQNVITVHVMGRVSTDIAGSSKLYVGVIEKEIHFTSAPGPNGEKDFYDVMKKLLPSSAGQSLTNLEADGYFAYTFTWELANIYNMDQLDAIAWVQNTNTKEVYQACKSTPSPDPFFANEAAVSDITDVKKMNCSGIAEPQVLLSNYGSNALTSAELEVLVNGEALKTVNWSGNMATFGSETVDLGEVVFPVEEENILEVRIKSVNNGQDEAPDDDIATFTIKEAYQAVGKIIKVNIRTDSNPQETTWKVTKLSTGEVIQEGGPYAEPNTMYIDTLVITADGCYDFTIYDAGGDGLTGSAVYGLRAGSSTMFSGSRFEDSESTEFSYEVTVDVEENLSQNTNIYPNPTDGLLNIYSREKQAVTIYNLVGQRVFEGQCEGKLQIDMKAYGAGIFLIQIGNETQRIVVK